MPVPFWRFRFRRKRGRGCHVWVCVTGCKRSKLCNNTLVQREPLLHAHIRFFSCAHACDAWWSTFQGWFLELLIVRALPPKLLPLGGQISLSLSLLGLLGWTVIDGFSKFQTVNQPPFSRTIVRASCVFDDFSETSAPTHTLGSVRHLWSPSLKTRLRVPTVPDSVPNQTEATYCCCVCSPRWNRAWAGLFLCYVRGRRESETEPTDSTEPTCVLLTHDRAVGEKP